MSVTSNAIALLHAGLVSTAGVVGNFRRGNQVIESITAVPAKAATDSYGDNEFTATSKDRDFIFWADDLVRAGVRWTPQRDDQFDWTNEAGVKRTFTVLPRDGDRCFRPTEPSEQQIRVYTIETKASDQ